jgi:hypothetical protein
LLVTSESGIWISHGKYGCMKTVFLAAILGLAFMPTGCSGTPSTQPAIPSTASVPGRSNAHPAGSSGLTELFNLNYSNGQITVFSIANGKATITKQFTPPGGAQGFAADAKGQIYTTLSETNSKPCSACVQIYSDTGSLVRQLDAPTLKSSPGAPSLNDVSVDAHENVYVADYGQQAVYFFPHGKIGKNGPTVVVQNSSNDSGVLATPNGKNVLVGGDCGFASVRPFTRAAGGKYTQGACFGIGTLGLIGGATDNKEDTFTPVDGGRGLVSISSPSGQYIFNVPDQQAAIGSVALSGDGLTAYVADASKECVYAFARPAKGWLSGVMPKVVATYTGFKKLNIIAVPQ